MGFRHPLSARAFPWIALLTLASPALGASWRVTLRNPGAELGETPIVAEIKAPLTPGAYSLASPRSDKPAISGQVYNDSGKTYLAFIPAGLAANETRTYLITPQEADSKPTPGVSFRKAGPNLEISTLGKLLTVYHTDEPTKPYYYPLLGPNGSEFTRAFPIIADRPGEARDHVHHRSFWFTYGEVNGVDFWASDPLNKPSPKFGTTRESSRTIVTQGPVVGILRTQDDWIGPDGRKVCEDDRTFQTYATHDARIIDFDVTLKATNGPLTFHDTKEGMLGVRVATSMDVTAKKGGKIVNARGQTDEVTWGQASPWVDYSGPIAGKTVGIAILNHPSSFRYPTTWHVRTYGLFAANPFGWHDFGQKTSGTYTVPAGESIQFRYRIILHDGDLSAAKVPAAFLGYSVPPTVELSNAD